MRESFLLLITVISFIASLTFLTSTLDLEVNHIAETNNTVEQEKPAFEEPVFRSSFTDLFSGTGWKDEEKTTVYQDFKTLIISFFPDYETKEIGELESVKAAKGNAKEIVLLAEEGRVFVWEKEGSFYNLEPQGISNKEIKVAALDYDSVSDNWIIALSFHDNTVVYGLNIERRALWEITKTADNLFPQEISLSCMDSSCLIGNGRKIWRFAVLNGASLREISPFSVAEELRGKEIVSFLPGKTHDSWLLGVVVSEKNEEKEIYKGTAYYCSGIIDNCQKIKTWESDYSGEIHFGYNRENQEVFIVYAAYFGKGYLISLSDFKEEDFSHAFHQRVMEGVVSLDVEGRRILEGKVRPEIFFQDNAWWISSASYSSRPKLLRISGRTAVDLTAELIGDASYFYIMPGFSQNIVYGIKGRKGEQSTLFRFQDLGFQKSEKVVWTSSTINLKRDKIVGGVILKAEAEKEDGDIKYFFSNDGGETWVLAELGKKIWFKEVNNDFRWKAELYPSDNQFRSPSIRLINLTYYYLSAE